MQLGSITERIPLHNVQKNPPTDPALSCETG
jgi:hypothetical protein